MDKENQQWQKCPSEILYNIFNYLSIESLLSCSEVSTTWKDIVYYLFRKKGLWPEVIDKHIPNSSYSMKEKCNLDWEDIYTNLNLWSHCQSVHIEEIYTYKEMNIKNIYIYRDNLIVICEDVIIYYNVETHQRLKIIETSYQMEYIYETIAPNKSTLMDALTYIWESDHMVAICSYKDDEKCKKDLALYGKTAGETCHSFPSGYCKTIENVDRFAVSGDVCYVLYDSNVLELFSYSGGAGDEGGAGGEVKRCAGWSPRWNQQFAARYCGHYRSFRDLLVVAGEVYLPLARTGGPVLRCGRARRRLHVAPRGLAARLLALGALSPALCAHFLLPPDHHHGGRLTEDPRRLRLAFTLEAAPRGDVTCARKHGGLLLLGRAGGQVEIWILSRLENNLENSKISVQYNTSGDEGAIVALDVCERRGACSLLVASARAVRLLRVERRAAR